LLLAKSLAAIRLDVPIEFSERELTRCAPNYDALRALYKELNFTSFLKDLDATTPKAVSSPEPQHQLADAVHKKSAAKREAAMAGQGDLFAAFAEPAQEPSPVVAEPVIAEQDEVEPAPEVFATAQTTPHTYHLVTTDAELRSLVERLMRYDEVCFDTETTGFDHFRDRIVGMSFAVEKGEAW
jgi:DNA polymerase-1